MNLSDWFAYQLKANCDGFVWAVEQVPVERQTMIPVFPKHLGEWTVARHIFHMLYYEKMCALPCMRHWLGEPIPSDADYRENREWEITGGQKSVTKLLAEFQQVRTEQITLLPQLDNARWNETRTTVWGDVSMKWIVSKTFQHTAEHTHDVMKIALFWDLYVRYEEQRKAQSQK